MTGIKDVAALAGVSVSTVSYVFSGKRSISEKTTARVIDAVNKLGYIPDASAQKLRGGKNHIIALSDPIHSGMNQDEYNLYFLETATNARNAGYDVLLLTSEDMVFDIQRVTRSNLTDGVILFDIVEDDPRARLAGTYGKPCVAIGYPQSHTNCACVDMDFQLLGQQAAKTLYDYGHRTFIFLRGAEEGYRRKAGYMVLLKDALIKEAKNLGMTFIESDPVDYRFFDTESFVTEKVMGPHNPTAIVSQADADILNSVLAAMNDKGISVPADFSVLACGTHLEGKLIRQPISEFPFTPRVLCNSAMQLLLSAIEDNQDINGVVKMYPPTFLDKGSLGRL